MQQPHHLTAADLQRTGGHGVGVPPVGQVVVVAFEGAARGTPRASAKACSSA
ncbi:hypothetical protein STPH1_4019 [Streptomyces sp. OM5714]|nr:hypothetical protein STPH1_4019 [Streptomyces sp. OM5714]